METISAKVKRVNVLAGESRTDVYLYLDKTVKGFTTERDAAGKSLGTDHLVETDVDYIKIPKGRLSGQLCELDSNAQLLYGAHKCCFTHIDLCLLLTNASITFNYHKELEGTMIDGCENALQGDCYIADIIKFKTTVDDQIILNLVMSAVNQAALGL